VCAFIGARIGAIATVWLTEGLTAIAIVALLPLPLGAAMLVLPLIGIALNGTSSVLYGSVPDLVAPERRARAGALRRRRRCARRVDDIARCRRDRAAHASAFTRAQAGVGAASGLKVSYRFLLGFALRGQNDFVD